VEKEITNKESKAHGNMSQFKGTNKGEQPPKILSSSGQDSII